MSVLDEILAQTRAEVARLRAGVRSSRPGPPPIDVAARLRRAERGALSIIAEIKKRSPSAGALSTTLDVPTRARRYTDAGVAMISVLVDRAHFDGGYEDLRAARAATEAPLLCKGFILDQAQVDAAYDAGADAVLLIAKILDDVALGTLHRAVVARGLTPIVEVVDEVELARACSISARVIGVNARDLGTLQMDRARALRVLSATPKGMVSLLFSGLSSPEEVRAVAARREIDGALVGEALMRLDDPTPLLASMIAAAAE